MEKTRPTGVTPPPDAATGSAVAAGEAPGGRAGGTASRGRGGWWPAVEALVPFRLWPTLSGISLVVPYYHMVSDAEVPHVRNLYRFRSVREFEADLDYFARRLAPVELRDIVEVLDGKRTFRRPSFHLTFDDGFREMHEVVAPLLEKKGIPATFFLNTAFLDEGGMAHHNKISLVIERLRKGVPRGVREEIAALLPSGPGAADGLEERLLAVPYADRRFIDRVAETAGVDLDAYVRKNRPYLSSEEVESLLRRGFTIGAHSVDHPLYADLPLSGQVAQTRESMDFLTDRFGVRNRAFAFPHTDRDVGPEFFEEMSADGELEVSFGTAGLRRHFHPRNVERMSMEGTSMPAAGIVSRQYTRAVYYRCRPPAGMSAN